VLPFSEVAGVVPGITVAELRELRPQATFRSVAFSESSDDPTLTWDKGVLVYDVGGTGFEGGHQPPQHYWVRAISWKSWASDDEMARKEWDETVAEWTSSLGPPKCKTSNAAVWQWEKFELLASWSPAQAAFSKSAPGWSAQLEKAFREPGYAFPQAEHCLSMGS
jgi:hypothetical protein